MKVVTKGGALAGIVALAVGTLVSAAHASLVGYSNVSSNGITISAIQEDNNDNFTSGHYGQPVFSNGVLSFPSLNQFFASANGGPTAASSDLLRAKLSFKVTMPVATATLFNLSEGGIFQGYGGGNGSVIAGVVVTDVNGNPITVTPSTSTVVPQIPFLSSPTGPATTFTWTGTLNPTASSALVTYTVELDNDLTATAPINPGTSFAYLDKKTLTITFPGGGGQPPIPEPASLGVLLLGSATLLNRRRRA
jgi:hypothetical protein